MTTECPATGERCLVGSTCVPGDYCRAEHVDAGHQPCRPVYREGVRFDASGLPQ